MNKKKLDTVRSEKYIKLYRGYASEGKIRILGHLLNGDAERIGRFDRSWWRNAIEVIRLFFVDTVHEPAKVKVSFNGNEVEVLTEKDGFFEAELEYEDDLSPGWHRFLAFTPNGKKYEGVFIVPCPTSYGIISDIDDTYLISHSANTLQKLRVMLFKNIYKRKAFEDVVRHYQLLWQLGIDGDAGHMFFNVSSSEWNLYDLIIQFSEAHNLPNAVLLLDDLKSGLKELLFSGQGSHSHKKDKIRHILGFYPQKNFILLGDDSQKDPFIYVDIVSEYSDRIAAIYIRQTEKSKKEKVNEVLRKVDDYDIEYLYFEKSSEAMDHSLEKIAPGI